MTMLIAFVGNFFPWRELISLVAVCLTVVLGIVLVALKYNEHFHRPSGNAWRHGKIGFCRRNTAAGFKPFGGGTSDARGLFTSWR